MSARLLKAFSEGKCVVQNMTSGEVMVYWKNENGLQHYIVRGSKAIDLLKVKSAVDEQAPNISMLRKSTSLRKLCNDGALRITD